MKDIAWVAVIIGIIWLLSRQSQSGDNEETWSWIDYKGHKYQIEVHRHVG